MAKRGRGKKWKKLWQKIFSFFQKYKLIILAAVILIGAAAFAILLFSLPSPKRLATNFYPASTEIYDRNGKLLYEIYTDVNRLPIKLSDLPKSLINATLAAEDKNFYQHHGFDFKGIVRALFNTLFKRSLQGGSTITQQLVKNALLTQKRTLSRKIKEALLAVLTEIIYSKDEILEMYFNQTPYGGTAYGVEAAARTFFGKSAKDLNLAESALLAGLPAAPTSYSPFVHPDRAKIKQEIVLARMQELKMINEDEFKAATEEKINFASPGAKIKAPHFVFYIKEQLVELFGERFVDQGGLKVTTTLDLDIQSFVENTVKEEVEKLIKAKATNGAALVTNPKTGEILAMIGSKNYFADDIDGKFNVTTALRQPGSAIKPLNYATGLELGKVTPATIFSDTATCFTGGPKIYCPKNYDNLFHGAVGLRFALGNSFNLPAVKMLALNGLETFIASASAAGLESLGNRPASDFGLSLTLGGGEVKMTEMATAFGVFANSGSKVNLTSIFKVEDRSGKILKEYQKKSEKRVFSKETAYLISHILLDNNARAAAFGGGSSLVIKNHPEVSVKTGTTNDKRDNWTIGFTPSNLTVVWVGNNDNKPMGAVASGITGASPIWNKIMTFLLEGKDQEWPVKPAKITGASVCNLTGAPPLSGETCDTRYEFFISGTIPAPKPQRLPLLIDKDTGNPIQNGEEKTNLEWQEHPAVIDPLGIIYCFDCPLREEPINIRY